MSPISNPFAHHHHHDADPSALPEVYDPAQESLADALRVTFGILKILMIVVVAWYAVSGWHNIDQQHVGVRLRMGRIVGTTPEGTIPEAMVLRSGGVFALPYPFEQVLEIQTTPTTINLDNAFWWKVQEGTPADTAKQGPLNPALDGSLLTGDANIMHARWSITYQIRRDSRDVAEADPQAVIDYVHHVGSPKAAEAVARAAAERGVVHTAAMTRADDLMKSNFEVAVARDHIQATFDALHSGLQVTQLTITRPTMPGPVSGVYQRVTEAVAEKARMIDEARKQQENILKNVAGKSHAALWAIIQAYEQAHVGTSKADRQRAAAILETLDRVLRVKRIEPEEVAEFIRIDEPLLIHGEVAEVISTATAYRETAINEAKREAREFDDLQPKFAGNAMVFKTDRLATVLESILTSPTVQTHYISENILLEIESNRDPLIKQQDETENLKREAEQR